MPEISSDPAANLSPEFQKVYHLAIQAERKPIEQMANRQEKIQTKANLLGDMIGKVDSVKQLLPGLNSPFAIREMSFISDDPKAVTGSADKSIAQLGKHSIEIQQLAAGPSAISNAFEDKDETRVGTGYITFATADGESRDVFIDYDNSTLEGIAKSINLARVGLQATVINDQSTPDTPFRLMVSSPGVGSKQDIQFPEFYFAGGQEDFFIESERDATNAIVKFKGFQIESPTNEITDLIEGATINLKGVTDSGKPATISIEQDIPTTKVKFKEMVEKLNQVFSFIQQQSAIDEKTDTSRTLGGDYSLRVSANRLRDALSYNLFGVEGSSVKALNDIGIQFNKKGTLDFDEKKFEAQLEKNYDEVVGFLTGDGMTSGVVTKLGIALNGLTSASGGLLTGEKKSFATQISQIQKRIDDKEKQVQTKSENLRGKLSRAQSAISALQGQGAAIQSGQGPIPGM